MSAEIKELTAKVDKLTELMEKVAVVIVKQDAHETEISELKQDGKKRDAEIARLKTESAVAKEARKNHEEQKEEIKKAISGAVKWAFGIAAALIVSGVVGMITLFAKLT